ncbi:Rieske 2Fe-2S domain-containing protein [Hydrogenophaga borbori]|uniref:Rieske 2Fe-2S domain-containing protein n=1 Tax=Hydrogenophaga borbori TaxID=2294117 RepID=UPI00301C2423
MKTEDNIVLTRVGPDTPAGRMLRRYWHPIGLSDDLKDQPKLVKLLGEELVLFRQPDGHCGLLESRCPHRGANLAAGYVESEGLRCPYHGWKFSATGACLDQPCEPAGSRFKERIRQVSYPVQELGGLVFAYLGPQPTPQLPRWDVLVNPNGRRRPAFARYVPANWLQLVDNHQDPSHTTWLHQQMPSWQQTPECHYFESPLGSIAVAARQGPREATRYVREVHFIAPNGMKVPIPDLDHADFDQPSTLRHVWVVPIDDHQSIEWEVLFAPFDKSGQATPFNYDADPALYDMPRPRPYAEYITPGTPDYPDYFGGGARGATVILRQDTLIQSSQGVVQPREHEHLATSDRGVMLLRRILKECIDAVARGEDPRGVFRDPPAQGVIYVEAVEEIVSEEEFQALLAHEGLDAARAARQQPTKAV